MRSNFKDLYDYARAHLGLTFVVAYTMHKPGDAGLGAARNACGYSSTQVAGFLGSCDIWRGSAQRGVWRLFWQGGEKKLPKSHERIFYVILRGWHTLRPPFRTLFKHLSFCNSSQTKPTSNKRNDRLHQRTTYNHIYRPHGLWKNWPCFRLNWERI